MSTDGFSNPITAIDDYLAELYAIDQLNHLMCTDSDIVKAFCKDTGECMKWRPEPDRQFWSKPMNFSTTVCQSDQDCADSLQPHCRTAENGQKLCAYDPKMGVDIFSTGTCEIVSQAKCEEFMKSPYTCNESKTVCNLSEDPDSRYYEWRSTDLIRCDDRENPCTSKNSKCLKTGECTCLTDDDCLGTGKCLPSDRTPGEKVCKTGGRCVFGNYLLREWCENPKSRCQPTPSKDAKTCTKNEDCEDGDTCLVEMKKCVNEGDYPSECKGSASRPGISNGPPFYYDTRSGRCFMTQPYCDQYVMDFATADGRSCNFNSDCQSGVGAFFIRNSKCTLNKCVGDAKECSSANDCAYDEVCHAGYCTGPRSQCGDTKGGEFMGMNLIDMTIGRTAFRAFDNAAKTDFSGLNFFKADTWKKGFSCEKESFAFLNDVLSPLLNNIPPTIECLVDETDILRAEILSTNYVTKIKLYLIVWQEGKATMGFVHRELKKTYPSLLKKVKGKWHLKMKWKSLRKEDRDLKRIYIMAAFGGELNDHLMQYVQSMIPPEEQEKMERIINSYVF